MNILPKYTYIAHYSAGYFESCDICLYTWYIPTCIPGICTCIRLYIRSTRYSFKYTVYLYGCIPCGLPYTHGGYCFRASLDTFTYVLNTLDILTSILAR